MIIRESTRGERIAHLTMLLLTRREIDTNELAVQMTTTSRNIQRDLNEISRVIPIYCDDGRWFYVDQNEQISPY